MNYEDKAGVEGGKRKEEGRVSEMGVSERKKVRKMRKRKTEDTSHNDASATSSWLVAIAATGRSGATTAAGFAFC